MIITDIRTLEQNSNTVYTRKTLLFHCVLNFTVPWPSECDNLHYPTGLPHRILCAHNHRLKLILRIHVKATRNL